jgi:hypothetical protein
VIGWVKKETPRPSNTKKIALSMPAFRDITLQNSIMVTFNSRYFSYGLRRVVNLLFNVQTLGRVGNQLVGKLGRTQRYSQYRGRIISCAAQETHKKIAGSYVEAMSLFIYKLDLLLSKHLTIPFKSAKKGISLGPKPGKYCAAYCSTAGLQS